MFLETCIVVCEHIKEDPKFGKIVFCEDLLSVSVFSYPTDSKKLQIQSLEEPVLNAVSKKADLSFNDVAMANETIRLLTETRNKRIDGYMVRLQKSLQEMKKLVAVTP